MIDFYWNLPLPEDVEFELVFGQYGYSEQSQSLQHVSGQSCGFVKYPHSNAFSLHESNLSLHFGLTIEIEKASFIR